MALKLFECPYEFGYIAESLEECLAFYDGAYDDLTDTIKEIAPTELRTVELDPEEDPKLPEGARVDAAGPGSLRVTATVRAWIDTFGEGEIWSGYA